MAKLRTDSDEKYVLDLFAEILTEEYEWQMRFDALRGDPGKTGRGRRLPVDAYFPGKNLILEYKEKQHFESVNIMDKRMTVSGVPRGEQRKIYDLRKEKWAGDNQVRFFVVSYADLCHNNNGRLQRNKDKDRTRLKALALGCIDDIDLGC